VKRNCTLVIARKRLVQKTASPVGVMCITKPAKLYCGTKKRATVQGKEGINIPGIFCE
jgi:hypothetical protein